MTLEENIKITLALLAEYDSSIANYYTDDDEIKSNIKILYGPAYQELSEKRRIIKTKNLNNGENYLPSDFYDIKQIIARDADGNLINTNYYMLGKKIIVQDKENTYILEYYAYPSIINEDTSNDFSLEIDQDVQMILPYEVANNILMNDEASNYQAFYQEYQRKLAGIKEIKKNPRVSFSGGYDI